MKTLINDVERGSNFLQGFAGRDLHGTEELSRAGSLEAYLAENNNEYIVEIPGAEIRDKEMELGIGEDHLSIFLRKPGQRGMEYRTVIFANEVDPSMARTEERDGLYRVIVPKVYNNQ